ncbi:cation:proton antiporter [Verrucomicrobiales bacterium BCK34]|nr:cation:proton antiporter [Verrucomicrobiales bacterium BCK34]
MILAAADAAHSGVWEVLFQLLVLLAAALVIGTLFEQFKQSAILGYLIAGMLLGPHLFGVVDNESGVPVIAELGVSLLLFAIGLEFSAKRLIRLGPIAALGGSLQVTITMTLAMGVALLLGLELKTSIAVGAAVALSSTACVLRLLTDRAEIDSVHGRTALGMLLLQDIAVVPLVLLVTMLGGEGGLAEMGLGLLKAFGLIIALVSGFLLLSKFILPPLMRQLSLARDRELLILLAIVLAIGSACAAHALELSPALGAFIAGMMLAESPFATQIRADIGGLRIIFITLFFGSVGMLGDPVWIFENFPLVIGTTILILLGKSLIITCIGLGFRLPVRHAVASGLVLAQVGEFGVVIAGIAQTNELFGDDLFRLLVSSTLLSLFITPLLIKEALKLGLLITKLRPSSTAASDEFEIRGDQPATENSKSLVMIVGFGPSGQRVARELMDTEDVEVVIIDIRPHNIDLAKSMGLKAYLGDATNLDFLIHYGILRARAIVLTVPDHRASIRIVESVRTLNAEVVIVARARYHTFISELETAGATLAVDEEYLTGRRLAEAMRDLFKGHRESRPD